MFRKFGKMGLGTSIGKSVPIEVPPSLKIIDCGNASFIFDDGVDKLYDCGHAEDFIPDVIIDGGFAREK